MMSDLFDEHYKKYDAWYDQNKYTYLSEIKALKKVVPTSGYGLEVGVGSGRFAAPLGIDAGIDPSKNMIELAKKRGVDARLGVGEKLPFKDSTFDYVALIVSLCFVKDPQKVIDETVRVLKPTGKIIIGIVDKKSFLGKIYQEKGSIFYGHARFFDIEEIVQRLKVSGFSDFTYYQTIFDHPDKVKTIEEPQEGFDRGGFIVIGAIKG